MSAEAARRALRKGQLPDSDLAGDLPTLRDADLELRHELPVQPAHLHVLKYHVGIIFVCVRGARAGDRERVAINSAGEVGDIKHEGSAETVGTHGVAGRNIRRVHEHDARAAENLKVALCTRGETEARLTAHETFVAATCASAHGGSVHRHGHVVVAAAGTRAVGHSPEPQDDHLARLCRESRQRHMPGLVKRYLQRTRVGDVLQRQWRRIVVSPRCVAEQ